MATAKEVAAWLLAEFERAGQLAQADAVAGIRARFGAEFIRGGRIRRDVVEAFQKLAPEGRVWDQRQHAWRRRNRHDPPDRGRVG
jgi:hypothetical protein